jgi:hypothetical protein
MSILDIKSSNAPNGTKIYLPLPVSSDVTLLNSHAASCTPGTHYFRIYSKSIGLQFQHATYFRHPPAFQAG